MATLELDRLIDASAQPLKKKVLVVDDEANIRDIVRRYLTERGWNVIVTDSGSEALILVRESRPDVILVDAEMPGLDGHSVCRVIKKEASTRAIPVIIMSGAMTAEKDQLSGFAGGADDYIVKPFSLPLVAARIEAVLRRKPGPGAEEPALERCGISLDPGGRTVKVDGKSVSLTNKEFDLLATLLSRPGRLLAVPYLLETVWGYDLANYNDPGTVEVHVSHLRKKLGAKVGKRIVNLPGHGYKFEIE